MPLQAWIKALWEEGRKTSLAFHGLWSSLCVGLKGWLVGPSDRGIGLNNIHSHCSAFSFRSCLKKFLCEVWRVCPGNPVSGKKINEFTNGFHWMSAGQTPKIVTLLNCFWKIRFHLFEKKRKKKVKIAPTLNSSKDFFILTGHALLSPLLASFFF